LIVFISFLAIAFAQSNVGIVASSDIGSDHIREVEAEWYPLLHPDVFVATGVSIQKNGDNTVDADAVEFVFTDLWQTTLYFGYYHAQGDLPTGNNTGLTDVSAAAFEFISRYFAIFEYVDKDGTPGFQNETDQITGFYDLSSVFLSWQAIEIASGNISVSGTDYRYFVVEAQTSDNVFLIRFTCVGYPAEVEGIKISPESVKVDIEVRWFNNPAFTGQTLYSTGPSDASLFPKAMVGIVSVFGAAAGEAKVDTTSSQPSLTVKAGGITGFFQWETSANVTIDGVGAAGAVYGTQGEEASGQSYNGSFAVGWVVEVLYFSFQGYRPSLVDWDPEFGADPYSANSALLSSPSFLIITLLISFLMSKY